MPLILFYILSLLQGAMLCMLFAALSMWREDALTPNAGAPRTGKIMTLVLLVLHVVITLCLFLFPPCR